MKFLRRKVKGTETVREEGSVIHREIEITVEREWLSVPSSEHDEGRMREAVRTQQAEPAILELPTFTKLE